MGLTYVKVIGCNKDRRQTAQLRITARRRIGGSGFGVLRRAPHPHDPSPRSTSGLITYARYVMRNCGKCSSSILYLFNMRGLPDQLNLLSWLKANEQQLDWHLFADPWDQMQRKHNPFRDEQIDVILKGACILSEEVHHVLDLGCGPGILGRRIHSLRPQVVYFGADGDPLMLTAMEHLLLRTSTHPLLVDIRSRDWLQTYQNYFDAAVSLTALHWLTKVQLAQLYRAVFSALKPGGRLVVGDPFLPDSPSDRKRLHDLQEQYSLREAGMTWDQFWTSFYKRYPIKEMRASHQETFYGGDLFEGSDDGYPISFYLESLQETGFMSPSIIWTRGLRVVYQAEKPIQ